MIEYPIEVLAREKSGQGPNWRVYRWEYLREFHGCRLTGAVAPLLTRGPNAGQPNWRKLDKATERTIGITDAERDAHEIRWERETWQCADCVGVGTQPHSCSKQPDGTYVKTRRDCAKCGGTGKAKQLSETA